MGPHIFQTCPSANYFDCKAMSIGARSQSARTYLERFMDKFSDCKIRFFCTHLPRLFSVRFKLIVFTVAVRGLYRLLINMNDTRSMSIILILGFYCVIWTLLCPEWKTSSLIFKARHNVSVCFDPHRVRVIHAG